MPTKIGRAGIAVACALSIVMLAGCIVSEPDDLTLLSIAVVNKRDQIEIPDLSGQPALGLISEADRKAIMKSHAPVVWKHENILKIEFSTKTDLLKFSEDKSTNIGVTAFLCDRPKDAVFLASPSVHSKGVWIIDREQLKTERARAGDHNSSDYYFYASLKREDDESAKPVRHAFDLLNAPEDICFYLSGGDGAGWGFKTNIVRIPKQIVSSATR